MRLNESASANWLWKALAWTSVIVGLFYLLSLLLAGLLKPLQTLGLTANCQANVAILTRGMRIYADDFDDHLPQASGWMDRMAVDLDSERRLHCPAVSRAGENRYGYAMNSSLAGKEVRRIDNPGQTPLIYDSTNLARSATDRFTSLPSPGRHRTRPHKGSPAKPCNVVGYVDGNGALLAAKAPPGKGR